MADFSTDESQDLTSNPQSPPADWTTGAPSDRIDADHSNKPNAASEGGVVVGSQAVKEPYGHLSTPEM